VALPQEHPDNGIRFLDDEEGREYFDVQARELIGMSGEEFLRRYDAGEYRDIKDDGEDGDLIMLIMMIPFAR